MANNRGRPRITSPVVEIDGTQFYVGSPCWVHGASALRYRHSQDCVQCCKARAEKYRERQNKQKAEQKPAARVKQTPEQRAQKNREQAKSYYRRNAKAINAATVERRRAARVKALLDRALAD